MRLDPPPPSDPRVRDQLAAASAGRYGQAWAGVEADIQSALARIELAREAVGDASPSGGGGRGVAQDIVTEAASESSTESGQAPRRNEHRKPKRSRPEPHQTTMFDILRVQSSDDAHRGGEEGEPTAAGEMEPMA